MADLLKWSKECKGCQRRYPASCGIATCLECKTELERTQKAPTVDEEEWKQLAYVHGRVIPGPLSPEERERLEREWDDLEFEAARRGPKWSVADLLEEGFVSVRAV